MQYVADLHIHSRFSMATSKKTDPEHLFLAAAGKGVTLVGTGDLTHPGWRDELKEKLVPDGGSGLYSLRPEIERELRGRLPGELSGAVVRFVLTGEISSIYKKDGRTRKVHNVVMMPDMDAADRFAGALDEIGNIRSDGRPILGLDCRELLAIALEADSRCCFIPAHIWTPHFSVFGARSGFDTLEHCFGDLTGEIYALETGLSSDPPMNWRVSALDRFTLVSNSDAHSPEKLAREANLIEGELSYAGLIDALKGDGAGRLTGTVEFYPEEGKYHFDGHRACKVRLDPGQAGQLDGVCPVCGGKLTGGVLGRVHQLADRPEGAARPDTRPYQRLIPLSEVLAESLRVGPNTRTVGRQREALLRSVGSELHILRAAPLDQVARISGGLVAEALRRNREGEVRIEPGYDGEYGTVSIFRPGERDTSGGQMFFFEREERAEPANSAQPPPDRSAPAEGEHRVPAGERYSPGRMGRAAVDEDAVEVCGVRLNREQADAVTSGHTPLAVAAGPGTGKTRCLTARAAWLVTECGVEPSTVLAVTFTNRAAGEMRERIARLLGDETGSQLRACTLHRFCLELLAARNPALSVADESDRAVLLARATGGIESRGRLQEISEQISRARARGERPGDFTGGEDVRRAWSAYYGLCRGLAVYDYDDLIAEAARLLESEPDLRARARARCAHLLVDEFQDLNPAQYGLIRLLAGDSGEGLFAIGDPNQSIYAFRGADSRIFDSLRRDYPGLKVRRLAIGYRCPAGIAEAANAVVSPVSSAESAPPLPAGDIRSPVLLVRAESEQAEALAVVREIARLAGGTDMLGAHGQGRARGGRTDEELYSFSDIAVVARTASLLGSLERALVTEGIPCRLRGGRGFLEHELVRGLAGWLRLLANPGDTLRALDALRLAGVDPESGLVFELRERAAGEGRPLLAAIKQRVSREVPLGEEVRPLAEFLDFHEKLRRRLESASPLELLTAIEERCLAPEKRELPEVGHLRSAAGAFDTVAGFAGRLALARQADLERRAGPSGEEVTLMTMHAAKGLEFPVVFAVAVERGLVPFTLRDSDPDEERRLLYVAMTRASRRLYLTCSAGRTIWGARTAGDWSPLIESLPPDCREDFETRLPERRKEKQLDLL